MLHCPNKNSTLYKLLKQLNGGSEGLATHYYDEVNRLQDLGVISSKRFEAKESGKMYYSIPKIITEKSVSDNMKGKKNGVFTKDEAAFVELERQLIERDIDWIKVTETPKAYRVELLPGVKTDAVGQTKMNLSKVAGNLDIISEEIITPILEDLKARFDLDYEFITDPSLDWRGKFDGEKVIINLANVTMDTPFHEFAHPFISIIRRDNKALYNSLLLELERTPNGIAALEMVKKNYPELSLANQKEEAIVSVIGMYASKNIDATTGQKLTDKIKEVLLAIAKFLGIKVNPSTLSKMTLKELGALMASDKKVDLSTLGNIGVKNALQKVEEEEEAKPKSTKFSKAELFLKYRIKKLRSDMKNHPEDSLPYNTKKAEADTLEAQLDELVKSPTIEGYEEVGKKIILDAAEYINKADNQDDPITKERWLNYIKDIINTWGNFTELKTLVGRLDDRLQISIRKLLVDRVNKHSTEKAPISIEKINSQDKDVSWWTHGTGSLSDLANYVAKTIGLEIRFAQNKVATENIKDKERIQKEVDLLDEYAKKNGVDVDALWDIFIIERAGTTELVREYNADNTENENWNKIHSTPELARFYKFYQDLIIEKEDASVFIEGGKYFIPNIQAKSVKGWFKSFDPRKTRQIGEGFEEDLSLDLVPLKLHKKIPAKNKNKDLGVALLQFSMFANNHKEMSEILPGLRLLQESLKYNEEDPTKQKQFRTSNDPNSKIDADKTNLWKMIDEVIKMQVIGEMKKDEGKRVYHTEYDNEGNVISEDYVDFRQVGDDLLKYNSLYRIGFSLIGPTVNLLFGDISNTLEAIGGRFFNFKQLLQASRIFSSQARKEDSALATLHKELNFLQELDDYQYLEEVRLTGKTKGVTGEKLQQMAYSLQKGGENWVQSRVALAIAIHDGYINTKGELTQKYKDASLQEKQKLSDKIQGVNHMNHGRYSAKEAAIWHQNFLFRAASQFRKWIPAAIENRFGEYNPHNNRLQAATEGRYNTLGRTVLKQLIKNPRVALDNMFLPLISAQKAIAKKQAAIKGTPTEQQLEDIRMEVYNMRKMTAEILLTIATVLIFKGLKGDDDDKEWRKNPFVKTALILTNRIAGDLQFFYDPTSITTIAGGIAPVNKLLIDVGKTISYTQYAFYVGDYKIKSGNFKDQNKFYKSFTGIAIGGNHYQDIFNKIMGKEELPEYRPTK